MTAKKCNCPPDSPFMWKHDHNPSIFREDHYFRGANAVMSQSQSQRVERNRAEGISIGSIPNLSWKAQNKIYEREFPAQSKVARPA